MRTILCSTLLACAAALVSLPAAAEGTSFTGLYAGGGLGYAHTDATNWTSTNVVPTAPAFGLALSYNAADQGADAGFASLHIGYQAEVGKFAGGAIVLGAEASAGGLIWDDRDARTGCLAFRQCATNVGHVLSLGGRAGLAFGHVLVYGQGGYANAEVRSVIDGLVPAGSPLAPAIALIQPGSTSVDKDGYYLGGGVDVAFGRVIVGVDYRHFDFGTVNSASSGGGLAAISNHTVDVTADVVQARISYRFGGN